MASNRFFEALHRSPVKRGPSRMLGGVCGGIAHKLGWRPSIVRVLTAIAFLLPVFGLGWYLAAWLLLPKADDDSIIAERLFTSNS